MPNIYVFITIIMASLVKGITGFGFALLSLPILLRWYAPKEIIPILMICNLVASLFIIFQKKEHKLIDESSRLLIASGGLFTIIGVLVLKHIKTDWLLHLSALVFIILTILSLIKKKKPKASISKPIYPIAGALIGLITGSISISGPPLALFLNRAQVENDKFREIFAWFSIVTASIAIVTYIRLGLLSMQVIKHALIFSPILLFGSVIGKRLNRNIPHSRFKMVNIILTLLSSLMLLND